MKFYATLYLAPAKPRHLLDAMAEALAPHERAGELDRWQPRGTGLRLRRGLAHRLKALRLEDTVVAAPKASLDIEAIRAARRAYAAGAWDAWAELTRRHPPARPRPDFDNQTDYLLQPAVQELAQAATTQRHPFFTFTVLLADPVTTFAEDRTTYVTRAGAQALATWAWVTRAGEWHSDAPEAAESYFAEVPPQTVVAQAYCHS